MQYYDTNITVHHPEHYHDILCLLPSMAIAGAAHASDLVAMNDTPLAMTEKQ
jgi:hypothetical protein